MSTDAATSSNARRGLELQTSFAKRSTTDRQTSGDRQVSGESSVGAASPSSGSKSASKPKHQRFVLADPVAFSYLEEDPGSTVLDRSRKFEGYQAYLVEQWACSRTSPTFLIVTYTGDPSHVITAGVLSVPADEEAWSPRMKVYFKALAQYHARRKETPFGTVMITNLNGFPSSLTVILVPGVSIRDIREDFFVNENLKRLGCTGRTGISLSTPSPATQTKFIQLYRTSDKVPLYSSVIELVKLCQVALMLFGLLEPEYADGLLCDVTEKAIGEWWTAIGNEIYNIEPTDGVLGPSTVSALLGTLLGARNRLQAFGAPVPKDVFDVDQTKRGIAYFQKSYNLPRSRRLDRRTIERLHRATDKQASGEGWGVPRAVKSTVAELSGKGGEMVMDMVGGRDKAGIAEVETADIDRFVTLVNGERSKWLWHGKPRKRTTRDMFSEHLPGDDGLVFQEDEENGYAWAGRRKDSTIEALKVRPRTYGPSRTPADTTDIDPLLKKTVLRRAKGRLKGAVGMKGHSVNKSKDEGMGSARYSFENKSDETIESEYPISPGGVRTSSDFKDSPADASPDSLHRDREPSIATFAKVISETPTAENDELTHFTPYTPQDKDKDRDPADDSGSATAYPPSVAPNAPNDTSYDLDDVDPTDPKLGLSIPPSLRRNVSFSKHLTDYQSVRHPAWWPRHLSFSTAEPAILGWTPLEATPATAPRPRNPKTELARELQTAADARELRARIAAVGSLVGQWTQERLARVEALDTLASQDAEQLNSLYYPRKDEFQQLQAGKGEILEAERRELREGTRDVEALGAKLEYEINALRGKVEDVEDAVAEFERQVRYIEGKVAELVDEGRITEGWGPWMLRIVTRIGVGRKPK